MLTTRPRPSIGLAVVAAALLVAAVPPGMARGQTQFPAVLAGHAIMPAATFVPPPADAPESLAVSGKYAAPDGRRRDAAGSVPGTSFVSDRSAARPTGINLPFSGQPVQGFSGIKRAKDGTFWVLTDNGFGNKRNSPDAMLMLHRLRLDWARGAADRLETMFLHDPDRLIPFLVVNEATRTRYLTGSDLDVESIQPIGDAFYFGDEFGPYLVSTDRTGKVTGFWETTLDGKVLRSPDHFASDHPRDAGAVHRDGPALARLRRHGRLPGRPLSLSAARGPAVGRRREGVGEPQRAGVPPDPRVRRGEQPVHGPILEVPARAERQQHRRLQHDRRRHRPDHRARQRRGRRSTGLPWTSPARLLQCPRPVQARLQDRSVPARCRRLRAQGRLHRPARRQGPRGRRRAAAPRTACSRFPS